MDDSAGNNRIESRRSSGGFVLDDVEVAGSATGFATITGAAVPGETASPINVISVDSAPTQPAESTDSISDDSNFDTALYDLDSTWEINSTCSTEPDEEYFSDFNQVEAYRQLRGVDEQTLRRKKRKVIDLVSDPESVESWKERKKRKNNKKSRKNKDDE
jgi:hypothetical protein